MRERLLKTMKAKTIGEAKRFTDIPNVGPRIAEDFVTLGFKKPACLTGQDPLVMYEKLKRLTKSHQDPCVLDVFMAVTDFANGGTARKWFRFTKERKIKYKLH